MADGFQINPDSFNKIIVTAATASTAMMNFKIYSNGSIEYIPLAGVRIGTSADKSFRINYRSKDGTDKTSEIIAITLDEAKCTLEDLDYVNYHIEG